MAALRKTELIQAIEEKSVDELFQLFKTNAEAIGAKAYRAENALAAKTQILEIIESAQALDIVVTQSPLIKETELDTLTHEDFTVYFDSILDKGKTSQIGITEADYAIAETGTLCIDSFDFNNRLASSLPPIHIALIRENKIVENFSDSLQLIAESGIGSGRGYYSFISGPSRTSDIERVLTIGVHGPEELHIIFVP